MGGLVDHVIINTNDFEKSFKFYNWLMPLMGLRKGRYNEYEKRPRRMDWSGDLSGLLVWESEEKFSSDTFDKHRVGLRELAFTVEKKSMVDEIGRDVKKYGGKLLDAPHKYGDAYVVFFTDPDGIKLEADWREDYPVLK